MNFSEESCTVSKGFDTVQITRLFLNLVHFNGTVAEYLSLLSEKLSEAGLPVSAINVFTPAPEGLRYFTSMENDRNREAGELLSTLSPHLAQALEILESGSAIAPKDNPNEAFSERWSDESYRNY